MTQSSILQNLYFALPTSGLRPFGPVLTDCLFHALFYWATLIRIVPVYYNLGLVLATITTRYDIVLTNVIAEIWEYIYIHRGPMGTRYKLSYN